MDSLVREVDEAVALGDEVVLLGAQGDEMIEVAEVSEVVGQIPWEVLSRLGRRPPRLYP
jgi:alanine racemase